MTRLTATFNDFTVSHTFNCSIRDMCDRLSKSRITENINDMRLERVL